MCKCFLWPIGTFSFLAGGRFSCYWFRSTQGAGTQGARPDPSRKFGPWPRSSARALGVQSGESPRRGFPRTWSHQDPSKHKNKLKEWMSEGSCDVCDLECRPFSQTLRGDGKGKRNVLRCLWIRSTTWLLILSSTGFIKSLKTSAVSTY